MNAGVIKNVFLRRSWIGANNFT